MTVEDVFRDEFQTFLDVTPASTATYSLLGEGIKTAKVSMNPSITEETWIHERNARKFLESYAPVLPVEASCRRGDPVFEYVDNLYRTQARGADAVSSIVNVYLYETEVAGEFPATKYAVVTSVDDFGGDGGLRNMLSFTFNYQGDPIQGTFNPTTKAFTPNP